MSSITEEVSVNGRVLPSDRIVSDPARISRAAAAREGRNFLVLALYQITMRTGWIFKTESIVMPAVLDTITGGGPLGGFLRGCLPVLSRLGHSIPPILFSRRLKVRPYKKMVMLTTTLVMATVYLLLSLLWWQVGLPVPGWTAGVFLLSENSLLLAVVPEPILLLEVNTKKPFNVTLKGDLGQDVAINSYQRVLLAKTYRCLPKSRTKSTRICTSRMVLLASDGFLRPPMHHRPLIYERHSVHPRGPNGL